MSLASDLGGRKLPIGAELVTLGRETGAHFRVWAPDWNAVSLVLEDRDRTLPLQRDASGYHSAFVPGVGAGTRYRFRLGDGLHADPASRFQPEGPFGPSEIIDPTAFVWRDDAWRGVAPHRHVIYELHVGTFTEAGTLAAAEAELSYLAQLGITTIELMPLADFAGARGWGYDGVNLFAPTRLYGRPDDLRRFVDAAHARGLAVILDVVYNHLGPAGNSLFTFARHYRAQQPSNEWGDALNFDGDGSLAVREFFIANARYWIDEFHLDGLRLDATQAIADRSSHHVVGEIATAARDAGRGRPIFLVAENEPQDARHLAPIARGGFDLDAMWNDDFHHTARVALTGVVDGYLHDYRGTAQELVSATKRGFLYQGQMYPWQRNPRGTPTRGTTPSQFVHFLTNHDQEANLALGQRLPLQTTAAKLRAMTALLLLGPSLPMLFAGQETGETAPWHFFVDHDDAINAAVRQGREAFVTQFARFDPAVVAARLPNPAAKETFAACVLRRTSRDLDAPWVQLHRDLLALRRDERAFTAQDELEIDGAVLAPHAFVLRWFDHATLDGDRLLLVNLGETLSLPSCPEPLIAPVAVDASWRLVWSSEDPKYGGSGQPPPYSRAGIQLGADCAVLLAPDRRHSLRLDPAPPDRQTKATFEP